MTWEISFNHSCSALRHTYKPSAQLRLHMIYLNVYTQNELKPKHARSYAYCTSGTNANSCAEASGYDGCSVTTGHEWLEAGPERESGLDRSKMIGCVYDKGNWSPLCRK